MNAEAKEAETSSDGQTERHGVLFGVRRSSRYHERRMAHFERLHRATNAVTILLAGVVLLEVAGSIVPTPIRVLAVLGALLSTLDLVIGFAKSADRHRDLKRRFVLLEREIVLGRPTTDCVAMRLEIESDEPAKYFALDILVHNELCLSLGPHYRDSVRDIGWWAGSTAQWWRWERIPLLIASRGG